ncbi:MAG: ASKHA domain-containing protein, partial [candidate division WOR-3 bacterium]
RVLREEAIFNPQNSLGGDVITRIGLALEGKYKLLRNLLLSGIKDISTTLGIRKPQFTVVVGNPVMLSFYLDKPVEGFASYPFKSELKDGMFLKHPARYVFPIIGGFVGGDTIAGLLACGFLRKSGTTLYIDLGTNGEVVLAWPGSVMAVSTAAGPAFEGAGIKAGSLAVPGAIDRVYYKGGIKYHTIGNKKPIGLCASGLIDLLAVMLKQGWLEPSGQLLKTVEIDGISINQEDIRKLQLAIGAIHVGIETLLLKASTMPARIDEAIITGEFGAHLNPASLVAVGLIPTGIKKIRLERDLPLRGAVRFLQDDRARAEVKQIQKISGHLELALEPYFGERFIWSLRLAPWK